jgi:hypothetical protein
MFQNLKLFECQPVHQNSQENPKRLVRFETGFQSGLKTYHKTLFYGTGMHGESGETAKTGPQNPKNKTQVQIFMGI